MHNHTIPLHDSGLRATDITGEVKEEAAEQVETMIH
jgi:hypothetical protein